MRVIAIWDIHWRSCWENMKKYDADHLVFIWDYFDTHENISSYEQIENFKRILEFKKSFKDKVTLLIWNHDFHYFGTNNRYGWYQHLNATDIRIELNIAIRDNLLVFSKIIDNVVYTHAGVTKTWLSEVAEFDGRTDLEDFINNLPYSCFEILPSKVSKSWDDIYQSPIWVRPKSLIDDKIDKKQVVWHTNAKSVFSSEDKKVLFIDILEDDKKCVVLEDSEFKSSIDL